jgi:hypothetical protein
MPNWCSNGITLRHADPTMIQRAAKTLQVGQFFQEFIPCPKELTETVAQFGTNDHEKANREKYGYGSWYDFNIANWGTKWDVSSDNVEIIDANTVTAGFDSAWAPPTRAYEQLLDLGFEVEAFYYEPGMQFVGKWDNGNDEYYELSGEDSTTVRASIGEELDDYFGISEQMADWEEENQEIDLDGGLSATNEQEEQK